jgi:hypothetical protein
MVSEPSENLLKDISRKLDKLCTDETSISAGLEQLKVSIDDVHSKQQTMMQCGPSAQPHPTSSNAPSTQPSTIPIVPPLTDSELHVDHKQVPYTKSETILIEADEAAQITNFLNTCNFKQENGHSVISFGEPYEYTGSKSSQNVPPIPNELKPLFEKINALQTNLHKAKYKSEHDPPPTVNSCLINKYEGPDSFLPRHSDREVTIHPESSIFTLSLGQSCQIKFIERSSNSETILPCPDRSLYHMTRRSQEIYDHMIERGSLASGTRFSLTFRAVSWTNKNATALHGDSNTGGLRFGCDKRGTFGELMPGRKFWSPRIDDIDPVSCMGYTNVVLLCGINDVRQPDVKCDADVAEYLTTYKGSSYIFIYMFVRTFSTP